jgi:hypothetical protein
MTREIEDPEAARAEQQPTGATVVWVEGCMTTVLVVAAVLLVPAWVWGLLGLALVLIVGLAVVVACLAQLPRSAR